MCSHSEGGLKRGYGLCQRMMHFFHQYLLYVTFEVLEPHWLELLSALKRANTLDEASPLHDRSRLVLTCQPNALCERSSTYQNLHLS